MATKDNGSGLLAKVAKFVRHPTKDWSDLDNLEPPPENGYSKQALKEMIERKRQNDFVRRREFDHLRKLRRNGPVMPSDQAQGRPSFFQSSLPSNVDERAMTIKKIDEIEAQMSKQWWKGKQDGASVQAGLVPSTRPAPPGLRSAVADEAAPVGENSFAPTQPVESLADPSLIGAADYVATQMGSTEITLAGAPHVAPSLVAGQRSGSRNFEVGLSDFSSSNLFPTEFTDDLNDPELEEAAIRFANGDDAGAESGLLAALKTVQASPGALDAWASALFDLYRCTGQQARFDQLALDYPRRSGQAAPVSFLASDLLDQEAPVQGLGVVTVRPPAAQDDGVTYDLTPSPLHSAGVSAIGDGASEAPSDLDLAPAMVLELSGDVRGDAGDVLSNLQAGRRANQITIDCSGLIRVDFSAAGSILNWVSVQAAQGCEVQFSNVPRLVAAFFNVIGINEHARVVLRVC